MVGSPPLDPGAHQQVKVSFSGDLQPSNTGFPGRDVPGNHNKHQQVTNNGRNSVAIQNTRQFIFSTREHGFTALYPNKIIMTRGCFDPIEQAEGPCAVFDIQPRLREHYSNCCNISSFVALCLWNLRLVWLKKR